MRYASIRNMDISNGEGIGVSLFVQGCRFHCYNCFNVDTWDFNKGKEWNEQVQYDFIELANKPYVNHISILGGEPLCNENRIEITQLIKNIKLKTNKKIWIWTGYTWEDIKNTEIMKYTDVLIDGRYIDEKRDITLPWRGSTNQRVIDVQKSLNKGKIVLYIE